MDIDKARKLKYGQTVQVPGDRGDKAYIGTVRSEDCATSESRLNHQQIPFVWVEVSGPGGKKAVWPSNRLGSL